MHNYFEYIRKMVQSTIDKNAVKKKSNNHINDK